MTDLNNDTAARTAIELLYFGYREFTTGPDKILEQRGLSRVHHRILYFIGRNDAISVSELLRILDVSKQALNAPLRQLVGMGLISNEISSEDRRVKELRLTRSGRRLEQRLSATQIKLLNDTFEKSGAKASAAWTKVMRHLAANAADSF